nr:MAG TPA: hypothetical protein [Caudoviricetes sp.]
MPLGRFHAKRRGTSRLRGEQAAGGVELSGGKQ